MSAPWSSFPAGLVHGAAAAARSWDPARAKSRLVLFANAALDRGNKKLAIDFETLAWSLKHWQHGRTKSGSRPFVVFTVAHGALSGLIGPLVCRLRALAADRYTMVLAGDSAAAGNCTTALQKGLARHHCVAAKGASMLLKQ